MHNRFERLLVEQCAPTLAGIKLGSLFRYVADPKESIHEHIGMWNKELKNKGLNICLIRESCRGCLVYVYRTAMLYNLLSNPEVKDFLNSFGYTENADVEGYLQKLKLRFSSEPAFPHEVGLFLGYPIRDVKGFIENKGNNFSVCGIWKVYGDRSIAEKLFIKYKKCGKIYNEMYRNGSEVSTLTVSA